MSNDSTTRQKIRAAKKVFIHFNTANGSNVTLHISKSELLRFMRVDGADATDEELWSWDAEIGENLHITFHC